MCSSDTFSTPIFYINLDRATERKEFLKEQARASGIIRFMTRFPAIDAQAHNSLKNANYKSGGWRPRWSMTQTEIAIFESHRTLWQNVVSSKIPHAIIMEDDIFISKKLPTSVQNIISSGITFDIIRLDGFIGHHRYGPLCKLHDSQVSLRSIKQTVPSAACYLISYAGAKKLLHATKVYSDHADDILFTPRSGWKALQLWETVAVQGVACNGVTSQKNEETIHRSERLQAVTELESPDKGPFAYRLWKELRRFYIKLARAIYTDQKLLNSGGYIGYPPQANDLPTYK